jgi:hypothetical protein
MEESQIQLVDFKIFYELLTEEETEQDSNND